MRRWPSGVGTTKRTLARELLHRLDDLLCPICRESLPLERLTKHHILPRSEGGPTTLENLVLICRPCHDDIHREPGGSAEILLDLFLAGRDEGTFPPPPEPLPPEECIRRFLYATGVKATRALRDHRFRVNPPFDPYWPVGRYVGSHGHDDITGPATAAALA